MEPLTDTLIERVDKLVEGKEPFLSTTPASVAIRELFFRTEALEHAMREIARSVGDIARDVQKLLAQHDPQV